MRRILAVELSDLAIRQEQISSHAQFFGNHAKVRDGLLSPNTEHVLGAYLLIETLFSALCALCG